MSTMTTITPSVKPTRTVLVAGEPFAVERIAPPHPSVRSWRLTSRDGKDSALVCRTKGGALICSCRCLEIDYQGGCVHSAALEAAGMFVEPAPEFESAPSPCSECGHIHDANEPDAWPSPASDDEPVLTVPDDDGPRLTLQETLEAIQTGYAGLNSDLGDLLAMTVGEVLQEVRLTGAKDVATLLDRRACLGS